MLLRTSKARAMAQPRLYVELATRGRVRKRSSSHDVQRTTRGRLPQSARQPPFDQLVRTTLHGRSLPYAIGVDTRVSRGCDRQRATRSCHSKECWPSGRLLVRRRRSDDVEMTASASRTGGRNVCRDYEPNSASPSRSCALSLFQISADCLRNLSISALP